MSIEQQKSPTRTFESEVVQNVDVCDNCYRLMFDRIAVPRIIADFRDAAPDTIRFTREDTTDDDSTGLFCRCGSDGVTQPDERPRDAETVERHARNLARTLETRGVNVDASELVHEARRLRVESDKTGVEMFREAVYRATR